jgi:hypothetical protein
MMQAPSCCLSTPEASLRDCFKAHSIELETVGNESREHISESIWLLEMLANTRFFDIAPRRMNRQSTQLE